MDPPLRRLYRDRLTLLTDLYQLTMAYGYWATGRADDRACFHLTFRSLPFGGGYAVAAGLANVLDWLEHARFTADDLDYLRTLTGRDDQPLFSDDFLDDLGGLAWGVDVLAVEEGTAVFPHEPLVRVTGPLLQCQLLETPLLTLINYPTLVATKAARICTAAVGADGRPEPVLEFGLRRAQGVDGGVTAARAAYVGGCAGTSNVLAGKLFGIPVSGTHAHSWVMSFDDERQAFDAYAHAMPANCVFLVDTYDTLDGVRHAIAAGLELRGRGHEMVGIRLDSGDMAALSIEARQLLDDAGFPDAKIVASSDLDEHRIAEMKARGGRVNLWGVGTRLTTAYDDPALGGVYKLSAIRKPGEDWRPTVKRSDDPAKANDPGLLRVRRHTHGGRFTGDVIYDEMIGPPPDDDDPGHDLLIEAVRAGRRVYTPPPLPDTRARTAAQLAALPDAVRRLREPDPYPVTREPRLAERKRALLASAGGAR